MLKKENRWKLYWIASAIFLVLIITILVTDASDKNHIPDGCPHCQDKYNNIYDEKEITPIPPELFDGPIETV